MVSRRLAYAGPRETTLERDPDILSKEYLDALEAEMNEKLGPASQRKPVGPSGW